ncbi:MAG: phosphoglucosamine mutase [Methanoregulaceae archaeon]|jgi:phosphomannomutase/phosphoglucomutase
MKKAPSKRLFGTNGVRGVVGTEITPDLVYKIGAAFGSMRSGRIAVGRDTRTSGETLLHALKAGLLGTGCNVVDCGILPTPALQFLIKEEFDGGAMITASHNPPEYNGVKIIESDGTEMGDEETIKLEQRIFDQTFSIKPWNEVGIETSASHLVERYIDAIVTQFPPDIGEGIVVAVDPGSGPACRTTPEILKRMGCRVLTVNGVMDGTFPGRLPEPTPEGLAELSALVVSSGASFGIAHDGDADRSVFVDEKGHYIEENREFALVAKQFCTQQKGFIVTPVSTSNLVEAIASSNHCEVVYTKVGSIYVARTMLALIHDKKKVVLGGEGNGGLIFPNHQFCRDGGMTAAVMVSIVAKNNKNLSSLVKSLPKRYMIKEKVKTKKASVIMKELKRALMKEHLDETDGLKITRGSSWALIRASGTEPLLRIIVESENKTDTGKFFNEIWGLIAESLKSDHA